MEITFENLKHFIMKTLSEHDGDIDKVIREGVTNAIVGVLKHDSLSGLQKEADNKSFLIIGVETYEQLIDLYKMYKQ